MGLSKERDVDMVLLGGDLFHDHTPSRRSMLHVIQSLRTYCLGDKPCELEFLSDGSEIFGGSFNHVNYEDPDINVAIPVFSVHGNHDEPTGHEFYSALDVLQTTGLVNYFGRVPKNDQIEVKPLLLRKGATKLAIYGLSNVRDERLFRVFRNGQIKFFQPNVQKSDWFNLMVVHQNRHARTPTGYLPESFLPSFVDLVIWGHEHECKIEPEKSSDQDFYVIQPGSSVVTQLQKGETVPKHVGILSVTGKEFQMEPIRLKTVRPFIFKEISLASEPSMKAIARKSNNRAEISRYLRRIILQLIDEANDEWNKLHVDDVNELGERPKPPVPLMRLRVDYTPPDGGNFDCENPQRITSELNDKIANVEEVILFHQKKKGITRAGNIDVDLPDKESLDSVKVEELVREFLTSQSLTVLPQNFFGDSVNQFVAKDDKHAMEIFVDESLSAQVKNLLKSEDIEQTDITEEMENYRVQREKLFQEGVKPAKTSKKLKPRPANYDSDLEGPWEDQPASVIYENSATEGDASDTSPRAAASARGRGRGKRGAGRTAAASTRKVAALKAPAKKPARGKKVVEDYEDEELDEDVIMDDAEDDEEDGDSPLFVSAESSTRRPPARQPAARAARTTPAKTSAPAARASRAAANLRQATLDFSQATAASSRAQRPASSRTVVELSDDEISDDDAFETPATAPRRGGRRR
jgi:double-strand break repair protein MRE11